MEKLTYNILTGAFTSFGKACQDYLKDNVSSPFVKYNEDFCSAIYSLEGKIVFFDKFKSLHSGLLPASINKILEEFPPSALNKGDCIITNDPKITGQPLIYLIAAVPVLYHGRPLFLAVSVMHYSEIGGSIYNLVSDEITDEGIVIPPAKIFKESILSKGFYSIIVDNIRMKEEFYWDLQSQYSALQLAAGEINRLVNKYGLENIKCFFSENTERSNKITEAAISEIAARDAFLITSKNACVEKGIKVYFSNYKNKFIVDLGKILCMGGLNPITPLAAQACFFEAILEKLPNDVDFNSGIIDLFDFYFDKNSEQKVRFQKSMSTGYSITRPEITEKLKAILGVKSNNLVDRHESSIIGILHLTGYSNNREKWYSLSLKLTDWDNQEFNNHSVEIIERIFPVLLENLEFPQQDNRLMIKAFKAIENRISIALKASDKYSIVLLENNSAGDIDLMFKKDSNPELARNKRYYLADIPQGGRLIIRIEL